jgi:hypothetical protein
LAPGYNVIETPDEIPNGTHQSFGRHIVEVYDAELGKNVFEFYSHVVEDNDVTGGTDRQRVEIKTYGNSPDNLKGTTGETVTYKWKFKVPVGFQPSSSFTHLHQIKAVDGDDSNPLFTLTPRKGTPNKLELIYVQNASSGTDKKVIVNLSLFEGIWVEATEIITIGSSGTYSMVIKKVSDGTTILSYNNANIATIRPDNTFIRPKWGIYRSLTTPSDLRDETVSFADFSITEGVVVVKQNQTITFNTLPTKAYGDADFAPGATASSGLTVSYASSNTAVATIVSGNIHIVGAGTSTITASQAGDTNYNAASSVNQTLTVNKIDQTITFNALAAKVVGDADYSAGATASSGLTVSYASSNTAVATIVGGNIHIVGAGTATITASQSGNANYNAATSVPQTLTVTSPEVTNYAPTSSTILFGTINSGTFSNLATNNSSYIVTNSTTSGTRKLDWYGSTTISQSPATVTKLTINYDGKNSASKTQVLYLYNWLTSAWTQIDSRTVSTSDVVITNIQTSPANFISSTGQIRLRVYSTGVNKNYTSSGDWMQFTVETSSGLRLKPGVVKNTNSSEKVTGFKVFPNPIFDSAEFEYTILEAGKVQLDLYNSNGQMIKKLINNETHTPGNYIKAIDVSGLRNGVYIAQLKNGNAISTIKVIVRN